MLTVHGTRNCGVFEIDGLSTMKTSREAFMEAMIRILMIPVDFPFVTFTGVTEFANTEESWKHVGSRLRKDDYGEDFAKFILNHKVGEIVRSGARENWSNNKIQLWVWLIDRPASYALYDAIREEDRKETLKYGNRP